MPDSKKHHFVPEFILRNFIDEDKQALYVFDKRTKKAFISSVLNAGHENNFNSINAGGHKFNFEDIFADIDRQGAEVIKQIIANSEKFSLCNDQLGILTTFIAVQQIRTKLPRTTIQSLSESISSWVEENRSGQVVSLPPLSEDASKLVALAGLEDIDNRRFLLLKRGIVLFQASEMNPLWTSDNPVVMHNEYPYGRVGLDVPGTNIYFPLSKNLLLGFICSITCNQIKETFLKKTQLGLSIEPGLKIFYDGIFNNKIIRLSADNVNFYNYLQTINSSRFLYGPTSNFSTIFDLIKDLSQSQEIKTQMELGGENIYPAMSPGEFIAFYLDDNHFLIPVKLASDHPLEEVGFYCNDVRVLNEMYRKKTTIIKIEIFKDKRLVRLMREVFVSTVNISSKFITIRHENEGIHLILKSRNKAK